MKKRERKRNKRTPGMVLSNDWSVISRLLGIKS